MLRWSCRTRRSTRCSPCPPPPSASWPRRCPVLDATGKVLLTATASAPGANVSLDLKSLAAGKSYYVKVEAARGDAFGVGGYRLTVGEALPVAVSGVFTTAFSASGQTLETNAATGGVNLGTVRDNRDARWDTFGNSKLDSATASPTITLTAKTAANALVVAVWAGGDISPNLRVTDAKGNAVAFQVLRADGFATVIQILGVTKGATYNVTLTAGNWKPPSWMGPVGYRFAADFRAVPITLTTFANGILTAAAPTASRTFTVTQSQLFRFELAASSLPPPARRVGHPDHHRQHRQGGVHADRGRRPDARLGCVPGPRQLHGQDHRRDDERDPPAAVVLGRFTTLTDPIGPTLLDPTAPLVPPPTATEPPRLRPRLWPRRRRTTPASAGGCRCSTRSRSGGDGRQLEGVGGAHGRARATGNAVGRAGQPHDPAEAVQAVRRAHGHAVPAAGAAAVVQDR